MVATPISQIAARLVDLDLFLQLQVEGDMLAQMLPLIEASPVKLLIDHCGRPIIANGITQPGFEALLSLGRARRAAVKLSGYQKFSRTAYPYPDAHDYVTALLDAFGPDACMCMIDAYPQLSL